MNHKRVFYPSAIILALLLAATVVIGVAYAGFGSILPIFVSPQSGALALTGWFAVASICYFLVAAVFRFIDNPKSAANKKNANKPSNGHKNADKGGQVGNRLPLGKTQNYFLYLAIILVCWISPIIIFSPGTVAADGYWQIDFYWLGDVSSTDIHPPASTYLIGALFFAGEAIAGATGGVALASGVQVVLALLTYAAVCQMLRKMGINRWICLAVAVFYGVVPLFENAAATIFKDSYYLSLFVLFELSAIRVFQTFQNGTAAKPSSTALNGLKNSPLFGAKALLVCALLGVALCLFRKEAVFIVAISIIALGLAFARQQWPRFLLALLVFAAALGICSSAGLTTSAVNNRGLSLEMASIPLQQTARFARDYPGEITSAEQEVLSQVFVYNADIPLGQRYDPELSDNVKGFNIYISPQLAASYASTYLAMGMRHPEVYLDAFLHQTYGYYSPVFNSANYYDYQSTGLNGQDGGYVLTPNFLFAEQTRTGFSSGYIGAWSSLPLELLWNGGLYTWILALLITCLLRQRNLKALSVLVPLLLVLAFCIISPVNGNLRYIMPIIAAMPTACAFVWIEAKSSLFSGKLALQ